MRFDTGIHPRQWHRGAWLLAFLLAALVLLFTHRPTGGAFAMELAPTSDSGSSTTEPAPPPAEGTTPAGDAVTAPPVEGQTPATATAAAPAFRVGDGYVAEIVDSSYTVGPAEFFALDLPTSKPGAKAVHLFGTVTTRGRKDIVVRLFRAADYDLWLKQKSGRKPEAFWTSPRSSNLTLDQDLPAGEPVVLLLDNGYSIRTPKKVSCQLQLRYERDATGNSDAGGSGKAAGSEGTKTDVPEDNLPTPRSNSDQEQPPPPPPPPSGY